MGKQSKFNIDERIEVINRYNLESDFSEGFAVFYDNFEKAWKIVDRKKHIKKIEVNYNTIDSFENGLAVVTNKNGLCGFINTEGEEVVPCKFTSIDYFSESLAIAYSEENRRWYIIDSNGKETEIKVNFEIEEIGEFHDGLAKIKNAETELWGFISIYGTLAIDCKYPDVNDFSGGLAKVTNQERLSGFIDNTGAEVIECKYEYARDFHKGLAIVQKQGRLGFIDKTGEIVIKCKYTRVHEFSNGLARVQNKKGLWGFINKAGEVVIPFNYEYVRDFHNGYAAVLNRTYKLDSRWSFVDKTGEFLGSATGPLAFMDVRDFKEGRAAVRKSEKGWNYINSKGEYIGNTWYQDAYDFNDGLAIVRDQKDYRLYGRIDKKGVPVIPVAYASMRTFHDDLFVARDANGALIGYVDKNDELFLDLSEKLYVAKINILGVKKKIVSRNREGLKIKIMEAIQNITREIRISTFQSEPASVKTIGTIDGKKA